MKIQIYLPTGLIIISVRNRVDDWSSNPGCVCFRFTSCQTPLEMRESIYISS